MHRITLFALLVFAFVSCTENYNLESGISLDLATKRSNEISNIRYDLTFTIPDTKEEPIAAYLVLEFESENGHAVVLDFNAPADHLGSVVVNDSELPASIENEHILLPARSIKQGDNRVDITFRAGDKSLNRNEDFLYTLFVPDRASSCFPVFDQPDMKARYSLTLELPELWNAISNGSVSSERTEEGVKTIEFNESGLIPSYLFAFTAGEFQYVKRELDGRKFGMLHRESDSVKVRNNLEEVFSLHAHALDWLEEYTGIDYPFEKFEFALIPTFQYGGMEHPGAISYRASSLFLDESPSVDQELRRTSLIAHETAHMWFGDLVTMEWFNDVWLKEVFANFMAAKITEPMFPDLDHELRFLLAHYPSAYSVDRTKGRHPIRQDLQNLKEAGSLYGSIIYQKAPIVMRQLEYLVGEEIMRKSLSEYLETFSYGNATWDDLVSIIDGNTREDVNEWSRKWVYGSGIPVLGIERDSMKVNITHKGEVEWRDQMFSALIIDDSDSSVVNIRLKGNETNLGNFAESTFIIPNSNGKAYAYFDMPSGYDSTVYSMLFALKPDVLRASQAVNLYESMLLGSTDPLSCFHFLFKAIEYETEPQILSRLLGYAATVYDRFLAPGERLSVQNEWETMLLENMGRSDVRGGKRLFYRTYRRTVRSTESLETLFLLHSGELRFDGLNLSENDKVTNSYILALRKFPGADSILRQTMRELKSEDLRRRMEFVSRSVASDPEMVKSFFFSLEDPVNREQEPWVLEALGYMFHPDREVETLELLDPALEWIQDIQLTGDIFFPKGWLDAVMGGHQTIEAVEKVNRFLEQHPELSEKLRSKILQSADISLRAATWRERETGLDL